MSSQSGLLAPHREHQRPLDWDSKEPVWRRPARRLLPCVQRRRRGMRATLALPGTGSELAALLYSSIRIFLVTRIKPQHL